MHLLRYIIMVFASFVRTKTSYLSYPEAKSSFLDQLNIEIVLDQELKTPDNFYKFSGSM